MNDKQIEELISRARRTETRVTQIAVALGVGTGTQKPEYAVVPPADGLKHPGGAVVKLPSRHSSFKEIADALPADHHGRVGLYIEQDFLGYFTPA